MCREKKHVEGNHPISTLPTRTKSVRNLLQYFPTSLLMVIFKVVFRRVYTLKSGISGWHTKSYIPKVCTENSAVVRQGGYRALFRTTGAVRNDKLPMKHLSYVSVTSRILARIPYRTQPSFMCSTGNPDVGTDACLPRLFTVGMLLTLQSQMVSLSLRSRQAVSCWSWEMTPRGRGQGWKGITKP